MKLEFLKMTIRTVFASKTAEIRKQINLEIEDLEDEVNQFEEIKQNTVVANDNTVDDNNSYIGKIDTAIKNLKIKIAEQRNKIIDKITFLSKAKWFEYGEKSNKFFLNLMKSQQSKKLI